jgi:hypothetical protein
MTTAIHIPAGAGTDTVRPGIYFRSDAELYAFTDKAEKDNTVQYPDLWAGNVTSLASVNGIDLFVANDETWEAVNRMATPGTDEHAEATRKAAEYKADMDAVPAKLAALQAMMVPKPPTRDEILAEIRRQFLAEHPEVPPELLDAAIASEVRNIEAAEAKRARRAAKKMKWGNK